MSVAVELRDVAFGYSVVEPPLVEALSLSLAPGLRLGFVMAPRA